MNDNDQGDALSPEAIETMREWGWSEAQIEAERRNAERIRAAGGFQNWVHMCEAARVASEARGYAVEPEAFSVKSHGSASEQIEAWAKGPRRAPIVAWAHLFALDLATLNGKDQADRLHAHTFERAMIEAARGGRLRLRTADAVGAPVCVDAAMTDDAVLQRLAADTEDVRAWAREHWPALLQARVLAESQAPGAPSKPTAAARYSLWDAAKAIGDGTAAPFERVLDALVSSANAGELTIYQAGATFPHRPNGPLGALGGHEAYWSDLNAWLRAHNEHGDFEFPAPRDAWEVSADTDNELLALALAREDEINGAPIDWERWTVKSATLTAAQAVRLMAGLDPDRFESLAFTKADKAGPAKGHARRLAQLAAADEPPKERDTPARWLAWAEAKRERVHGPYRLAIEQAARAAAPAEQAATVAAQGTPAEQWKAADAQGKVNLAIEAMREHGTQEKAAKALKISRQRLAEKLPADLRKGSRKGSAALASPFPESPWKPHKR